MARIAPTRDDMTPEMMARVVMENYDPSFASRTRVGDVIVGGLHFGAESSREPTVTCLNAKGIRMIISSSFSQTYLRNAYNNGFLCIEVPGRVKRLRAQLAGEIVEKEKKRQSFQAGTSRSTSLAISLRIITRGAARAEFARPHSSGRGGTDTNP
jgi:3-isopropylmalate dehydratase small subunit